MGDGGGAADGVAPQGLSCPPKWYSVARGAVLRRDHLAATWTTTGTTGTTMRRRRRMTVDVFDAWLRDDDDGSGGGGGGLTGSAHGFSHSLVCVAMIVSALIGHFWRKER